MARLTRKKATPGSEAGNGEVQPAGATAAEFPSREEVARRAYELYLKRGGSDGSDLEDWLRAEQELTGRQRA